MRRPRLISIATAGILAVWTALVLASPVIVRHKEGIVHGFLALRTLDGKSIADGDLLQVARGSVVTSRLVFHFHDGSLHDETAVYSQDGRFRLLSDHLIQHGPSFPRRLDLTIDTVKGTAAVTYDDHGKERTVHQDGTLPDDLANGIILTLLKNIRPGDGTETVSYLAATPTPRLVKLVITPTQQNEFSTGGVPRKATQFAVHVSIGGIAGVVASVMGKQPPDSHVWILQGEAPAFVKSEQPLYSGGPVWRIELVSPVWPQR
jgi:hypothetical protein